MPYERHEYYVLSVRKDSDSDPKDSSNVPKMDLEFSVGGAKRD
jgi:hypothetical protein